jgi:nucleotide-binding universal stress UspA family protein
MLEDTMINHILVPLDGSALAECVLPHIMAVGRAFGAQLTLLHVLEPPHSVGTEQAIDPLDKNLKVKEVMLEGLPADYIVDFANHNDVDLIALSSHGRSGLSGWNVSSVVQKVILRSFKSTLLIRAYKSTAAGLGVKDIQYSRLFVGLDYSARAEYILPVATSLAKYYQAELILGTVIQKPEILHRFPISEEEESLVRHIAERNYNSAAHYFEQLRSQLSLQDIHVTTRLVISDNPTSALHDLVDDLAGPLQQRNQTHAG